MNKKQFRPILQRAIRVARKAAQDHYDALAQEAPKRPKGSAVFIVSTQGSSGATRLLNTLQSDPFNGIYVQKLAETRFRIFMDGIGGYDDANSSAM